MMRFGKDGPLIALGLYLSVGALPARAEIIFSEDYEVSTLGGLLAKGWSAISGLAQDSQDVSGACVTTPCNMDIITAATGKVHSGAHALRMSYQIGDILFSGASDARIFRHFDSFNADDVYERYWVYNECLDQTQPCSYVGGISTDPNWPGGPGPIPASKQHYIYAASQDPHFISDYLYQMNYTDTPVMIYSTNLLNLYCEAAGMITQSCSYYPQNVVNVPMNQWVCLESHVKMNTPGVSDGAVEFWVNGAQTTSYQATQLRPDSTYHWNEIMVYRQGAYNLYRYEDDYVVSTTRVGCGSAPPANPPPSAPGGVKVL